MAADKGTRGHSDAMAGVKLGAAAVQQANKDPAKADKDHAEYLKSAYIPAILDEASAQQVVHDAKLMYLAADQAEQMTRQAFIEAPKNNKTADIVAIEAKLKDQSETTKAAHLSYTEAVKEQTLAKTTLQTATKA